MSVSPEGAANQLDTVSLTFADWFGHTLLHLAAGKRRHYQAAASRTGPYRPVSHLAQM